MNHIRRPWRRSLGTGVGSDAPSSTHASAVRSDRGVALVEFAIVLPLVCLMLFGIIEFGKGYNDYQALRQGVREAARAAVVDNYRGYDVSPLPAGHEPLDRCSSSSHPPAVRKAMCLTKHESGIGLDLRVRVRFTGPTPGDSADHGAVKVCAERALIASRGVV